MPVLPPDDRLVGRWRRTLLVRPDGSEDRTTQVAWLQAVTRYVDLRLPAGLPATPAPPAELSPGELHAFAGVEGFAGVLRADGLWTRWTRTVDLQPAQALPDEGLLEPHGADLVETGRHARYLERWRRVSRETGPVCAAELQDDDTGAVGLLVRVGDDVGWARGRPEELPAGGTLAEVVATGSRAEVLAAFDTEVALGVVAPGGRVRITASSLPGRAGGELGLTREGDGARQVDVTPDGAAITRRWRIRAVEGDPAALPLQHLVDNPFPHHQERSA